jgi:hypothetical protein
MNEYQQWEYSVHSLYPGELETSFIVTLNDQGLEGWEAVAIFQADGTDKVLMKRHLVSAASANLGLVR